MMPDRCPDCGVLSGSVHHALCSFQRELSPDRQLMRVRVRVSAAPCPWCGEHFELRGRNQKHHAQSAECYAKALAAQRSEWRRRPETRQKNRERWRNLPAEKTRKWHRVRDSRRAAERAQKRAQREAETATFRHVEKPFALAACMANKRYLWLRKMDNADYEQTLYLALLDAGIDPEKPAYIDTHRMQTFVLRHMARLQCDCGFRRLRERGIPSFVDVADLADVSPHNWHATWASA
jgi:hypothetical protein